MSDIYYNIPVVACQTSKLFYTKIMGPDTHVMWRTFSPTQNLNYEDKGNGFTAYVA